MGKCLQIYYDEVRDGKIKEMIQELRKSKDSPYYKRRSDSEVALIVLGKALRNEVKKFKNNSEKHNN